MKLLFSGSFLPFLNESACFFGLKSILDIISIPLPPLYLILLSHNKVLFCGKTIKCINKKKGQNLSEENSFITKVPQQ